MNVPSVSNTQHSTPDASASRLRDQARDFVNITFLSMLMRAMRKTVPEGGLLSGGRGEQVFRGQLDTVLIDRMSKQISTPLADAIVRQSSRHPSVVSASADADIRPVLMTEG